MTRARTPRDPRDAARHACARRPRRPRRLGAEEGGAIMRSCGLHARSSDRRRERPRCAPPAASKASKRAVARCVPLGDGLVELAEALSVAILEGRDEIVEHGELDVVRFAIACERRRCPRSQTSQMPHAWPSSSDRRSDGRARACGSRTHPRARSRARAARACGPRCDVVRGRQSARPRADRSSSASTATPPWIQSFSRPFSKTSASSRKTRSRASRAGRCALPDRRGRCSRAKLGSG